MTNQTCRCSTIARSADLLPWADPYILQLFEEAERARREEVAEWGNWTDDDYKTVSVEASGVETRNSRDPWRVNRPRRLPVSRRRRTEFALELAPC
jgi:hypothetical protein